MILVLGIFDAGIKLLELDLGIFLLQLIQNLHRLVIDGDVGRSLGLFQAEAGDLTAVHQRQAALFGIHVAHGGQVGQLDRAGAGNGDLRVAQRARIGGVAQHADRLFRAGDFGTATRRVQIDLLQLRIHLRGGDAIGLQLGGIQDDANLAADTAAALDRGHAADRQQPLGDGVVHIPGQFLQRHVGRFGAEIGDRAAVDIDAGNLRLQNAIGQVAADLVHRVLHIVDRAIDRDADFELDAGARRPFGRDGGDFVHPADAAHGGLDPLGDLGFQLGRRSARLADDDTDDREADVGIIVDVHPAETDQPRQQQCSEHHQRRHRVADRPCGHIAKTHDWLSLTGRPAAPVCSMDGAHRSRRRAIGYRAFNSSGLTFCPGVRNAPADVTIFSVPAIPPVTATPASDT